MEKTYYVAMNGSDLNDGSADAPFRTINHAAQIAKPGNTVVVREGEYREWVKPCFGGNSDKERITYQATEGENVVIKGSEIIKGWKKLDEKLWTAVVDNSFFGDFNPYTDELYGDWYKACNRVNHSGEVYLNGISLYEAATFEDLKNRKMTQDHNREVLCWHSVVNAETTTIYADFGDADPNAEMVEINVRRACFFPVQTGINYITVRGFEICHAATQWAPPTSEQIGMIGPNWSRGWIIEQNKIHDSKCVGISLGKEKASGNNYGVELREKAGFNYQLEAVFRALQLGWSKNHVGSHIVRNNDIYNCEQAGIVGHMGCAFSQIIGNHIHHIHQKKTFAGAEIAGIKFHAPIDAVIQGNRIHDCHLGMWLDWQNQGVRVSRNLLYKNTSELFVEVCHGPCLFDNNIFLSGTGMCLYEQGLAMVHNLITGPIRIQNVLNRSTPYHFPHSTLVLGTEKIFSGDDRYFNNLFIGSTEGNNGQKSSTGENSAQLTVTEGYGLCAYDAFSASWEVYYEKVSEYAEKFGVGTVSSFEKPAQPVVTEGNVYYYGATPCVHERKTSANANLNPVAMLTEEGKRVYLIWNGDGLPEKSDTRIITTEILGKVRIAAQGFENPDGSEIVIDTDYFGNKRGDKPVSGPFEFLGNQSKKICIW